MAQSMAVRLSQCTHQVYFGVLHDHFEELGARNLSVLITGLAEIDFDLAPRKHMSVWYVR